MTIMSRSNINPLSEQPTDERSLTVINFWVWFCQGSGTGDPGYKRIINGWGCLHLFIGAILAYVVPKTLDVAAATVLLPLAGVFVGLSFAWAGNAQALLQTDEISLISKSAPGGLRDYVFSYQLAILALLITLAIWGIAGLGLFEKYALLRHHPDLYRICALCLYAVSSFSLRECWHVVMFAQAMLLARADVREAQEKEKQPGHIRR